MGFPVQVIDRPMDEFWEVIRVCSCSLLGSLQLDRLDSDFTIFWVVQKVHSDPILLIHSHNSAISLSHLTWGFTTEGCILKDPEYLTIYLAGRDRMAAPACPACCHHDSDTGRPTITLWAPPPSADRSTGGLCSGPEEHKLGVLVGMAATMSLSLG